MAKHNMHQTEELIAIVAKLTDEYTGLEHSSATNETTQMLMEGVLYCINECRNPNGHKVRLRNLSTEETYALGREIVVEKVKELHAIYNELIVDFDAYGSECLDNTIHKEIPMFLSRYDAKFMPQETLLTLDYPILKDLSTLTGIDQVLAYIKCIVLEQRFLRKFDRTGIIEILESHHEDYRTMTENICVIVLQDLIFHFALEKPPGFHNFTKKDLKIAQSIFSENRETAEFYIMQTLETVIEYYYDGNMRLFNYLKRCVPDIAVQIPCILQIMSES